MRGSVSKVVLLVLGSMALLAGRASAWGNDGHKIVCRIAYLLLEPQEQAEIDRLTKLYRKPDHTRYTDFADACTFPDLARNKARKHAAGWTYFSRFNQWHFLNVPRDTREVKESDCGNNCVLKGVDYHSARLANHSLEDWKRAEALFFLGHWLGDVHQPLHISFADDQGGNLIKPITGGYYPSDDLHAVWDGGIIQKGMGAGGWRKYAARLKDRITPALRDQWRGVDTPLTWAQESYTLTTTPEVDYCVWTETPEGDLCGPDGSSRKLLAAYQKSFQDDVEMRLQQAGVRLAERIHKGLGQ